MDYRGCNYNTVIHNSYLVYYIILYVLTVQKYYTCNVNAGICVYI